MERPRRPGKRASAAEWDRYHTDMAAWKSEQRTYFGTGAVGAANNHTAPVHGTTADGQPVTAAFGKGSREGETYLSDGHAEGYEEYWGPDGNEHHDHYDGRGGGTQRGRYTGFGS